MKRSGLAKLTYEQSLEKRKLSQSKARKPLKKKAKEHTQPWYRKKCVEIAKLIAKKRDNWTCVTCGRTKEQGYQMHGSHILPESKFHRMSCEPINIMCQCARCHMDWHEHPLGHQWLDEKYPFRAEQIIALQTVHNMKIVKPDYKKILAELKSL